MGRVETKSLRTQGTAGPRWHVMYHLEMQHFKEWLLTVNAQRLAEGTVLLEPFFPCDFFPGLSRFVFLKGTDQDVEALLNDRENQASAVRLRHYLDTNGQRATVPEGRMLDFMDACQRFKGGFEITPPVSSVEKLDQVRILAGPFSGYEASVLRVHHARGAIHLDLSIPLVSGALNIRLTDVDRNRVVILGRSGGDCIRTDFIEYAQNHLLEILDHRVRRVRDESVNRQDADMLTRIWRYRNYEVENAAARQHFLSLMLICAHLCRFREDEKELKAQLQAALEEINRRSPSRAATDTRAYLMIALYIVTRDPAYRDAVKQYVRDNDPKSSRLRRFVSLIRQGRKV